MEDQQQEFWKEIRSCSLCYAAWFPQHFALCFA